MKILCSEVGKAAQFVWFSILENDAEALTDVLDEQIEVNLQVTLNGELHKFQFKGREQFIKNAQEIGKNVLLNLEYFFRYKLNEIKSTIETKIRVYCITNKLQLMEANLTNTMAYRETKTGIVFDKYVTNEKDILITIKSTPKDFLKSHQICKLTLDAT